MPKKETLHRRPVVKVVLTAPQGAGKTRLAREIRRAARRLKIPVRISEIMGLESYY